MADEPKPITTQFANKDRTIEVGGKPNVETGNTPRDVSGDQNIPVRALRTFHKGEHMTGDMATVGEEFDCPRGRAAELRANGLIEYVDASEAAKLHGEAGAKQIEERVQRRAETEKATVEKNKTTPLRNPELKLADVPDEKSSKK